MSHNGLCFFVIATLEDTNAWFHASAQLLHTSDASTSTKVQCIATSMNLHS